MLHCLKVDSSVISGRRCRQSNALPCSGWCIADGEIGVAHKPHHSWPMLTSENTSHYHDIILLVSGRYVASYRCTQMPPILLYNTFGASDQESFFGIKKYMIVRPATPFKIIMCSQLRVWRRCLTSLCQ